MYDVMHLPGVIELGFTGEKGFRPLQFDMRPWLKDTPDGVPSIIHIRPGETKDDAYIAATTFADGILTWVPSDGDLGETEGYGRAQLWLELEENNSINKRGKSAKFQTYVQDAVNEASETVPDAQTGWMEQMTALKVATVNAKTAAETAQAAAEDAAEDAQEIVDNVWYIVDTQTVSADDIESGSWGYSTKMTNAKRLRSKRLFPVRAGTVIHFTSPTLQTYIGLLESKTAQTYIQMSGWKSASETEQTYKLNYDGYMTLILRKDDVEEIDVEDYDATVVVEASIRAAAAKAAEDAADADASATAAGNAQTAAETAQGKAEDAQDAAEDAQGAAETAQGNAETAQAASETAQGKAEDAQAAAELAQGKAEDAQAAAEAAQAAAEAALADVGQTVDDALEAAKESGEFDGADGADGADGYSPTATVSKSGKVATITITDKNGTTTAQVSDGEDGQGGDIIDDDAGSGDTNKVWSADKSAGEVSTLNGAIDAKYTKPSGGIPATDIASGVIPDVSGKQDTSNLVTSLSSSSTDAQYPSAKCVYDIVGNIETLLAAI